MQIQLGSEELWHGHGFEYVCTVTLTLEIMSWVKVMTHPLVMDNNSVKYYLDLTSGYKIMTDRHTDRVIPIYPPNFVAGGIVTANLLLTDHKLKQSYSKGIYSIEKHATI